MSGANQEHGIVALADDAPAGAPVGAPADTPAGAATDIVARLPIGTRLRILPNHACATGSQFPEYQALSAEGETHTWTRFHGW